MGLFRHRHRILSASLPTAQSYSPTTGAVGDTITLTGTAFGAVQGAGAVTISGRSATIVSWSATSIVFKVPAQTSYPSNFGGVVVITNAGASSLAPGFFVTTGGAAHFTAASSQILSAPDSAVLSLNGTDWTISLWVQFDSIPASDFGILAKWGAAGAREYRIYKGTGQNIGLLSSSNGTLQPLIFDPASVTTGTWYHIVGQLDSIGNTISLFKNATSVATPVAVAGSTFDGAAPLQLGAYASANFLDGRLDGVSIWKRKLTGAEITTLYNAGVGLNYASAVALGGTLLNNLAAWWDLDDSGGSGATWIDRLGVSNLTAGVGTAAPTSIRGVR